MKRVSKTPRILAAVLAAAIIAVMVLDLTGTIDLDSMSSIQKRRDYVPYTQFEAELASGHITDATMEQKKLTFTTSGGTFTTDNPQSPTLKQELLSSGASVTVKDEASVSAVLDIVFDVLFFGLVLFGILKFVQYTRKTFRVVHHTGVHFSDIAGMDNVKKDMMFLTDVLKNPGSYENKGLRPVKGVVLEGPPGNGKTLFAKALAEETDVNFIATKGADFQSAMMSMGARKIKALFNKASRNKPCIVFIDEFDSIGERRNYAGTGIDKENNRIITTMLNEMDGFSSGNGILVIAATNSYASLDPALIRPGRFDLKYTIGNPDASTRARLVDIYTRNKALADNVTKENLVQAFEGLSCAAIEAILNEAGSLATMSKAGSITLENILEAARKTGSKLNIKIRK